MEDLNGELAQVKNANLQQQPILLISSDNF